jgi:hypothetical protein
MTYTLNLTKIIFRQEIRRYLVTDKSLPNKIRCPQIIPSVIIKCKMQRPQDRESHLKLFAKRARSSLLNRSAMISPRIGHSMNPHSTKNTQDSHSTTRFSLLLITHLSSVQHSITSKGLLQDTKLIDLHINNNHRHNNNNLFIQKRS